MIDFGKTLSTAREAKGLSVEQVAEKTHLATKTVRELEATDFSSITAPIYGRGFVKLYCQAVGLEPKPLVDEFMEIYSGNRDITIRERPIESPPEEPTAPAAEPVSGSDFSSAPVEATPVETKPVAALETELPIQDVIPPQMTLPIGEDQPAPSRYAPPIHDEFIRQRNLWPAILRTALLAIVAGLALWGIFVGLRVLYRSTNADAPSVEAESAAAESCEPKTDAESAATIANDESKTPAPPRTPQKVEPLYID